MQRLEPDDKPKRVEFSNSMLDRLDADPDLTPLDFFLWGYVKDKVYATPVRDLRDLRERIIEAIESIPEDMLQRAWQEIVHRLDIATVTARAHVATALLPSLQRSCSRRWDEPMGWQRSHAGTLAASSHTSLVGTKAGRTGSGSTDGKVLEPNTREATENMKQLATSSTGAEVMYRQIKKDKQGLERVVMWDGLRSGEEAGHGTGPLRPIHRRRLNTRVRCRLTPLWKWAGAPSCTNHMVWHFLQQDGFETKSSQVKRKKLDIGKKQEEFLNDKKKKKKKKKEEEEEKKKKKKKENRKKCNKGKKDKL
ncbi:hypothetical protein ANN_19777 [Periplaneta americana]|uniref:Uncharacterized protein n=1 Tax=Periplaneta americana TaxID=6978 RepID=A0ABQ8SBH2_PERAM|nr:hypothetical protein ANN_19777 [Periplaneta americana]